MNYPYEATVPLGRCALATVTRLAEAEPWRVVVRSAVPRVKAEPIDPGDYERATGRKLEGRCIAWLEGHFGRSKHGEQPMDDRVEGERIGPSLWKVQDNTVWWRVENGEEVLKPSGWWYLDRETDYGFVRELEQHIAEADPVDTAPRGDVEGIQARMRRSEAESEEQRKKDLAYLETHDDLPPQWRNVQPWMSYGYSTGPIGDLGSVRKHENFTGQSILKPPARSPSNPANT